jgi:formylglycine-generating enzyme required for sulfatase activity/tRNA A-37 threonylcarbamoyl transferase component Bud32/dienelactone hydrolase
VGRGGMATVFLAHDIKHDRSVAIKVLHPEVAAALGAERFLREIRIAAHLQHPHILTLIDSGEIPRQDGMGPSLLYYVMPYVEGETLRERLTREGRLSPTDTARLLQEVLDALTHAHGMGIVHRDIKPENIMLSGRHALVMDFGVAKAASVAAATNTVSGTTLTALGLAIGTPAYMAPEQATGQADVDTRADLYAVGVLAYEMLTGQPPFTGTTPQAILAAQITEPVPPITALRPDLAAPLAMAVMRCLEKAPEARWQSAEELRAHVEAFATPGSGVTAAGVDRGPGAARRVRLGAAIVAVVVIGAGAWLGPGRQMGQRRWAREQGIPQLLALADRGQWDSAYTLARRVEAANPRDSLFRALRPRFAGRVNLHTNPPGAAVWRKEDAAPDAAWVLLGKTPLDSVLLSLSGGGGWFNANQLRIERPGYRTLELVGMSFGDSLIRLDRDSALPPDMVRIPGGDLDVFYPGFEHIKPIRLGDYLMDRFEVTNREFKRFVDSGGYRRRELWNHPFVKDGRVIPWAEALARMTDRTGRTGPATWEAGEYPAGQANHPVAGVSWYEAAAFAKFTGKSLPTVAHWNHAASVYNSAWIVPASNFSGRGTVPVGSTRGISAYGTYDMAGNVREWCLNASGDQRFILGGGWNDEPYQFNDAYTQAPFDRSPTNGIRMMKYFAAEPNLALAAEPLQRAWRDFLKARPVTEAVFAAYRQIYAYDRTPLAAKVVETVDEGDWTRELVRMNAAYAGDSLLVYLYLPKRGVRPYPGVVFFPGSNAIRDHAPQNLQVRAIDFIIKSGRAVLYPVYKGTYQRSDSLKTDVQDSSNFYRDHVVMWAKDLRRGVDYLETRPEVATGRLAYYGLSWGGAMGGLMPAVEPRIRVSLLYVAGLGFEPARPEVDPINFLPRIRIPTLMINGRYDFFFPLETSQIPMFRLLGTPADQKRHVVEDGSHFVPRTRLIQEALTWLDKYQPLPE